MTVTEESVRVNPRVVVERVACRVFLNASQADLTADAWNRVAFNAETYDLGLNFDTSLNKFTVPVTGLYRIDCIITFESSSVVANKRYSLAIYVGGVSTIEASNHAGIGEDLTVQIHDEIYLNKDDYLEAYAYPSGIGGNTVDIKGEATGKASYMVLRLVTKEGIRQ